MIRRYLTLLIMFFIVIISFVEAMLWLLKAEISVSRELMTVGILVISLIGLFILTGGRSKKDKDKKILLKKDKDSILISESAIKQVVKNSLAKISSIASNEVCIKYNKEKKISLKLELILAADTNIVKVTELVGKHIHESFDNILEERVEDIQVVIKGFNEPVKKV